MRYAHQLELKARQVEQTLRRIGRLAEIQMRAITPSPSPYAYRNRITVHAQDGIVGFYRRDEHQLLDIEQCPIAAPEVNEALARLRSRPVRDGHYALRSHAGPRVFSQINDAVALALAEAIAALIPIGQTRLIDAYCGAGFFGKHLREKFEHVVGIDWDVHAIDAARAGASEREEYFAGEIAPHLRAALQSSDPFVTTVLADPPATGLSDEVRRALLDHPPATFLYISCNPGTLARDLAELQAGFEIVSVAPFDMFPQTAEIEVLAHLRAAVALALA
jgi:tRNA/tmRNA/rRNA uracil-C5-methylase (TrmA/RlmC/RlmD family)